MKVIGIICEYSPLHNGHIYHINKIKELYPDSIIILVVSGYFLQRGEVSILSKEDKTKLSLEYGIDIVLELPLIYGIQSADIFAKRSIEILNYFKVDSIVFGSECNNINTLENIAKEQINNKDNLDIKKYLKMGYNYPTSLSKALNIKDIISSNDLLGISYIKTIIENNYNIEYITIKRTNDYLDTISNNSIISATNIRKKLNNNISINKYIPNYNLNYINNIDYNKLFELIKYRILTDNYLDTYLDVNEGIDKLLKKVINNSNNIEDLLYKIKSKRYTYNRLSRMLMHILLGIDKSINNINISYVRVLGFNNKGKDYLKCIKKDINTCIDKNSYIYKYELIGASIYEMITNKECLQFELSKKPIYKEKDILVD